MLREGRGGVSAVTAPAGHHQYDSSASTGDLVGQAAMQISTLVRAELALAKAELTEKGKRAGIGGGLFGGAAVLAVYGLGLALVLAVVALDLVWPLWLAVLVVTVVVFAAAGIAALVGRRQLQAVGSPVPQETVTNVQQDVDAVKAAAREGRS
ncbi:phage holin family protein [Dactylosporangium sp. CS-047395]|uniref:phage holin family protein n=1 Tax=Dactylosporangium sp. CS-047395 TaxID=3239936 RepID=UPI003D8A90C6